MFLAALGLGFSFALTLVAEPKTPTDPYVILGISGRGDQNMDYQQYDRMRPVYEQNRIKPSIISFDSFMLGFAGRKDFYQLLKSFHVIALTTSSELIMTMDSKHIESAKMMGTALAQYVSEGGGLLLFPQGRRYANSDDVNYWNMVLEPLGMKILYENVYDSSRSFEAVLAGKERFWFAEDIRPHPISKGVERVCFSQNGSGSYPGVPAVEYSKEWQIVTHGSPEAKSYKTSLDNVVDYSRMGKYGSAAPLVAVRNMGKGRVVSLPVCFLYTGLNYGNPRWPHIVETKGDEAKNQPSHTLKLMMNSYRWLAEPVLNNPEFGTFVNPPYKPAKLLATAQEWWNWCDPQCDRAITQGLIRYDTDNKTIEQFENTHARGIFGCCSSYAGGKGNVAAYGEAAKQAGLSFIVFADPLEKLTPANLEKLKADCAKASAAGDFYACPGIEFTDGIGNRWAAWGSKVVYPPKTYTDGKQTYTVWDGARVQAWGYYRSNCVFSGCGLLDYKQLRANQADPQNLWWFYHYFPFVYAKDRLIANNFQDFLFGLRDLRWAALASFTRIDDPADVKKAADACATIYCDLAYARKALESSTRAPDGGHVTQGPLIVTWQALAVNQANILWSKARGEQRVRCLFIVQSSAGIQEVRVHDADRGVVRRFLAKGEKQLVRDFEIVRDQQHWLVLEVVDNQGRRAIGPCQYIANYDKSLFRCGDNLNTLPLDPLVWHPDRNQALPWGYSLQSNFDYDFKGYDGWGWAPMVYFNSGAHLFQNNGIYAEEAKGGLFPGGVGLTMGRNWDVKLASYNLDIIKETINRVVESACTETRPEPAFATVTRTVGPMEFFEAEHTLYLLRTRKSNSIIWGMGRVHEGMKDYRGSLSWNEGQIKFLQDVTLSDELLALDIGHLCSPSYVGVLDAKSPDERIGYKAIVKDADQGVRVGVLEHTGQPVEMTGRLQGGGYVALMPCLLGYVTYLIPQGNEYWYRVRLPSPGATVGAVILNLAKKGDVIKAGTVKKFAICQAAFADRTENQDLLEHTAAVLNMAGGAKGYPCEVKVGKLVDAVFFCTVEAKGNEAVMKLGPQDLIVDLGIRIKGLEDNGCAAVYTTARPWFRRVPVVDGVAYYQEPIDAANQIWTGNMFVTERKELKVTVVEEDRESEAGDARQPFVEVHNPTNQDIETVLTSPPSTPTYGGFREEIKVPAGDSIHINIEYPYSRVIP